MARSALVGHRLLGVIPRARLPGRCAVAAYAIDGGRHMLGVLAGGVATVMATSAISGGSKALVIHPGCRSPRRGLVAGATCSLCYHVTGRFARSSSSVMTVGATSRRDTCVVKLCAGERYRCVTAPAAQLGLKVGRRLDHIAFG